MPKRKGPLNIAMEKAFERLMDRFKWQNRASVSAIINVHAFANLLAEEVRALRAERTRHPSTAFGKRDDMVSLLKAIHDPAKCFPPA